MGVVVRPDARPGGRRWSRRVFRRLVMAVAVLAVATASWLGLTTTASGTAGTSAASGATRAAPTFSLPSVRGGGTVGLGVARGHPVLLNFFASWCPGCQQEMHTMAMVSSRPGSRVEVIGVDVNDSDSAVVALLRRNGISYPVGADAGGAIGDAYRLVGLPTTVFLNTDHRVVGQVVGPLSATVALSWLRRLNG